MKFLSIFPAILIVMLIGCEYEAPLVAEHSLPVDSAVLGLWEEIPEEGKQVDTKDRMLILKYSDTEYLVHYPPEGNDELYYRAYPIKIGGHSCVQLQLIGTDDGALKKDVKKVFHVVSYQLNDGKLELRLLNTDLLGEGIKTTDDLKRAFLKNKDNKELFKDPGNFRRIKK